MPPLIICTPYYISNLSDPYYKNVSLLMHMDNGPSNLQGVTFNQGNGCSMSNESKFGEMSAYFNGGGDGLRSNGQVMGTEFNTSPFTAEAWVNFSAIDHGPIYTIMGNYSLSTNQGWRLIAGFASTGEFNLNFQSHNSSQTVTPNVLITANSWHHVAVSGDGTSASVFIDGKLLVSTAYTPSGNSGNSFCIGVNPDTSSGVTWPFFGYIDEVRITTGVQRYTSSFTIPTLAFPDN